MPRRRLDPEPVQGVAPHEHRHQPGRQLGDGHDFHPPRWLTPPRRPVCWRFCHESSFFSAAPALLREQTTAPAGAPDDLYCLLDLSDVAGCSDLPGRGVQPVRLGAQVQVRGPGCGPGGQVAQLSRVGLGPARLGQLVDPSGPRCRGRAPGPRPRAAAAAGNRPGAGPPRPLACPSSRRISSYPCAGPSSKAASSRPRTLPLGTRPRPSDRGSRARRAAFPAVSCGPSRPV